MAKLVFLFGLVCIFSLIHSSLAIGHFLNILSGLSAQPSDGGDGTYGTYGSYASNNTIEEQIEFHTAIANGIYDVIATLAHKKLDVILFLKRAILNFTIRAVGYLKYFILHNPEFVQNVINNGAELLKLILTNKPHFAVPHIMKIISEATPNQDYGNYAPTYGTNYGSN